MTFFPYGKKEMDHLSGADRRMRTLIDRYGKLRRKVTPDLFQALVESMIAQQISGKAAATVNQRLRDLMGSITPGSVARYSPESIQQCGTTYRKAGYIKSAASAVLDGIVPLSDFHTMDDDAIVRCLVTLPGVGRWTAEMLLLHALRRPDIFSSDDLIIRRSLMALHNLAVLDKPTFETYRRRYSPYGSVAMIYLWRFGAG